MSKIYRSFVKLGSNENVPIICINHKEGEAVSKVAVSGNIHNIHIIDRSGSMSSYINDLVENIKETIKVMGDNDLISLLWFSGRGEYKTLIKGASKSTDLTKLLDSIKSTIGMTHFSEVLQECRAVIDDLKALCPNFNVTMFTDGCPQEDSKPILEQVALMKDNILAFHTVGYGNYYNKELLKSMSALSQHGVMFHSAKMSEYLDIFTNNYNIVKDLAGEPIKIRCTKFKNDAPEILYLSSKVAKLYGTEMTVNSTDKNKNQIFIIGDVEEFLYNGETYKASVITADIKRETVLNMYYGLMAQMLYTGRKGEALEIAVKNLGHKQIADLLLRSFTLDEINWAQKMLNRYVYQVSGRELGEGNCTSDYLPDKNAFCAFDLFRILGNGDNYYVPTKNYQRIGLKTTDTFNLFTADKDQQLSPFSNFVYNGEKLNMSILFRVSGTVAINPKEAKRVDLPTEIPTGIFRNHTIIKDGFLNMDTLELVVDKPTLDRIMEKAPAETIISQSPYTTIDKHIRVALDLTKIPIINQAYAETSTTDVLKLVRHELLYSIEQKILNFMIKRMETQMGIVSKTLRTYTPDQIAVLEAHGLDKNLNYKGVDNKTASKDGADFYMAKIFEFGIKGFSSIPTAEICLTKSEEMANPIYKQLYTLIAGFKPYFNNATAESRDTLERELKEVKRELLSIRSMLAATKIAKTLTGDNWFENTISDGKGGWSYTEDGITLLIKTGEEKVYF